MDNQDKQKNVPNKFGTNNSMSRETVLLRYKLLSDQRRDLVDLLTVITQSFGDSALYRSEYCEARSVLLDALLGGRPQLNKLSKFSVMRQDETLAVLLDRANELCETIYGGEEDSHEMD